MKKANRILALLCMFLIIFPICLSFAAAEELNDPVHEDPPVDLQHIRLGLCYYDSFHQVFVTEPEWFRCFPNGTASQAKILRSNLSSNKLYYGFINNVTYDGVPNGGIVSGTVYYYDRPKVIDPTIE